MKQWICLMLALTLCVGFFPAVTAAGTTGFTDIPDAGVEEAAELLSALGIISGISSTKFNPNGTFDRAMLAVIGAKLSGITDPSSYATTARFPDVSASNWAYGWISAAVDLKIMVGMPDGTFQPDEKIQFRYLITVLMRLLGYQDADVGLNWPGNYISKAKAIGLTEGMDFAETAVLTRGQTALILRNFIDMETKDGGPTCLEKHMNITYQDAVMLLQDIGGTGYYKHPNGTLKENTSGFDASLDGKAGTFMLDSSGSVLAFTEDKDYRYETITVSKVYDSYLKMSDDTTLSVSSSLRVITYGGGESAYSAAKSSIWTGETIRLAYKDGVLQYMYRDAAEHRSGVYGGSMDTILRPVWVDGKLMIQTDAGVYTATEGISSGHYGKRGSLVMNEEGYAISFTPDSSCTYKSVTLDKSAANGLYGTDGAFTTVLSNTPVWNADGMDSTLYGSVWLDMMPGEELLLCYKSNGALDYIYRKQSLSGEAAQTVVLTARPEGTANPLQALFGTVTATLIKNGCVTAWQTLEAYDVLSYYPAADVVYASNIRFTGLSGGQINLSNMTMSVMGQSFPVSEEAAAYAQTLPAGRQYLYLLDHQGSIADIVSAASASATVLATAEGFELADGTVLAGSVYTNGVSAQGLLGTMNVSPSYYTLQPVDYTPATADFSLNTMKIGSLSVAPWCLVYERGGNSGIARRISLDDIPSDTVSAANIKHVGVGSSGYVTLLLLQDVSYDGYDYGIVRIREEMTSSAMGSYAQEYISVTSDGNTYTAKLLCANNQGDIVSGSIRGISTGRSSYTGGLILSSAVTCNKYTGLDRYSFTSDGYALIDGKKLPLDTSTVYIDGEVVSLEYARAHCSSITAYTDPANVKVRFLTGI